MDPALLHLVLGCVDNLLSLLLLCFQARNQLVLEQTMGQQGTVPVGCVGSWTVVFTER